jgi:hypothetical protein
MRYRHVIVLEVEFAKDSVVDEGCFIALLSLSPGGVLPQHFQKLTAPGSLEAAAGGYGCTIPQLCVFLRPGTHNCSLSRTSLSELRCHQRRLRDNKNERRASACGQGRDVVDVQFVMAMSPANSISSSLIRSSCGGWRGLPCGCCGSTSSKSSSFPGLHAQAPILPGGGRRYCVRAQGGEAGVIFFENNTSPITPTH